MKVGELIAELQKCNPDSEVRVEHEEWGVDPESGDSTCQRIKQTVAKVVDLETRVVLEL